MNLWLIFKIYNYKYYVGQCVVGFTNKQKPSSPRFVVAHCIQLVAPTVAAVVYCQ